MDSSRDTVSLLNHDTGELSSELLHTHSPPSLYAYGREKQPALNIALDSVRTALQTRLLFSKFIPVWLAEKVKKTFRYVGLWKSGVCLSHLVGDMTSPSLVIFPSGPTMLTVEGRARFICSPASPDILERLPTDCMLQ